jgi:hypothetical protein
MGGWKDEFSLAPLTLEGDEKNDILCYDCRNLKGEKG